MEWIRENEVLLWWLAVGSAVMLASSLILVPWTWVAIPADYFSHKIRPRPRWALRFRWAWFAYLAIKNVVGLSLVVVGVLLIVLPGQGVLCIVAGAVLMDIPGKHRLVWWLIGRPAVLRSINWFRRRAGRKPLTVED
mgnify:FL=1